MSRLESSSSSSAAASLTQQVMEYVRSSVMAGTMKPGELYSVYQLADELGFSRSPVRDGLLRLEEAGMIRFSRNRGFRVLPTTPEDVAEIFSIRIALEVPAARRAATAGAEVARQLTDLRNQMQSAATDDDEEWFFRADQELHSVILRAGGARRARHIVEQLRTTTRLLSPSTVVSQRGYEAVAREHDPIIDAIARGDAEAAADAMRTHLISTGRLLVDQALTRTAHPEGLDTVWNRLTEGYPLAR